MATSDEQVVFRGAKFYGIAAMALLTAVSGMGWAASSAPHFVVSQLGQNFQPKEISIRRDDTLQIVNDDADLLHHAYISSDRFSFDAGDMEPGSKVDIKFPVAGEFNVLCGIHPKMRLRVRVN
jgi:plastocyanin